MLEVTSYILIFVVMSGLMAMVDAAVLSVSRAEVEEMVQRRQSGATALRAIVQRLPRAVVVIVLLTNTINILGPILAGSKAVQIYGDAVIGVITAILTLTTIIFSEIIPKSLGAHYAPVISRVSSPIILAFIYALYPLVITLAWVSRLFQAGERPIGTEIQIRSLVTIGRRQGYIENDEGQLIHRAFILNDKTAADVMTLLKDVVSVDTSATIHRAADEVIRNVYSRYPVFGKSIHDVKGMVLCQDLLEALSDEKDNEPISSILRPALTIEANARLDELLVHFRDLRIHLAIVQENGKTVGIVTLEDILEELVGEIEDERDP